MARKNTKPRRRTEAAPAADVHPIAVALVFAVIAFAVYAPALSGPFFSDDQHYVEHNVYVHELSLENQLAIWSPTSVVVELVENWAPVQLTLHSLSWQLFGAEVFGHHVVNVLLHAAASTLLFMLFARAGIARPVALGLAAFFLVHPANVEAVAWISQLKTTSSLVLALAALLLHPRRPALALIAFALALLAKPTAAVALPVAFAWDWLRADRDRRALWLVAWAAVFAVFAVAELGAFFETAGRSESIYAGAAERLRSHTGIVLRYAIMAVTGWPLSLFHEPPPARSWLDPWWLGGLALVIAIGWRLVVTARRGSLEAVFWLWAAVSFVPVSGILALPYPMADRYLYFILPGLLGGAAFAAPEAWEWLRQRWPRRQPHLPARLGIAAALVVLLLTGVAANRHATRWAVPEQLLAHTEQSYPDGQVARLRIARRAAAAGNADVAIGLLRAAVDRGFDRLDVLLSDPVWRRLEGYAGFDAIVDELARQMAARIERKQSPSQVELRLLAQARIVVHELEAAEFAYQRALEVEGPYAEPIRLELEALQRQRRLEAVRRR